MTQQYGSAPSGASLGSAMTRIASQILSVDTASVTFAAIPNTYTALLIEYSARTTSAGTAIETLLMQFNGDTGANYDYTNATDTNVGTTAETFAATSLRCGLAVQNGAAAGLAAGGRIFLPEYAGTAYNKTGLSEVASKAGLTAGSLRYERGGLFWRNAAAIATILLFPGTSTFQAGCLFRLYGIT